MPPRKSRNSAKEPFVSLDQVKEVLDKVESLKLKSANTYINHLRLFMRDLKTDNLYSLFNDYEKTAEYIETKTAERSGKPITLETQRTYFVTLNATAGHVDFVKKQAKEFFQSKQDTYNKLAHEARAKNKILEKHKGDPPKWDDLKDLSAQFKNGAQYGVNHLIVSIYTLIPPRRSEYRTLVYLDKKPDGDITVKPRKASNELRDTKGIPWNFVYQNEDGGYTMILRDYKTNQTYDIYEKVLPDSLSKIIKGYIQKHDIEPNTVMIRTNRERKDRGEPWRPLKEGSWTTKVTSAFALKYDKHMIAIDALRHAFINSLKLNDMTTEEKEKIATDMSHSLQYQDLYRQYVTDNEDISDDPEAGGADDAPEEPDEPVQQIDMDIKMATLAMLKSQTEMFQAQAEYYRAQARVVGTNREST